MNCKYNSSYHLNWRESYRDKWDDICTFCQCIPCKTEVNKKEALFGQPPICSIFFFFSKTRFLLQKTVKMFWIRRFFLPAGNYTCNELFTWITTKHEEDGTHRSRFLKAKNELKVLSKQKLYWDLLNRTTGIFEQWMKSLFKYTVIYIIIIYLKNKCIKVLHVYLYSVHRTQACLFTIYIANSPCFDFEQQLIVMGLQDVDSWKCTCSSTIV